jgi:hypothetical protein
MVKRALWLMLPFLLVCAGLAWMAASLPTPGAGRGGSGAPPAPVAPPAPETAAPPPPPAIEDEVRVHEFHRDPDEVMRDLEARGLGVVATWMEGLNEGDLSPIQVATNLLARLNDRRVQPLPAARLARVLPEAVPGFTAGRLRTRNGGGWMASASAVRTFTDPDRREARVQVMDTGSMHAVAELAQALASTADLERENAHGLVRTRVFRGQALFEKLAPARAKASLHLFAGHRFIVEIESRDLSLEQLRPLLESLRLEELPLEPPR